MEVEPAGKDTARIDQFLGVAGRAEAEDGHRKTFAAPEGEAELLRTRFGCAVDRTRLHRRGFVDWQRRCRTAGGIDGIAAGIDEALQVGRTGSGGIHQIERGVQVEIDELSVGVAARGERPGQMENRIDSSGDPLQCLAIAQIAFD
jgi:hypothetical protein